MWQWLQEGYIDSCFINRSIGELNIRKASGANLIGLKTKSNEYIFNPSANIRLQPEDKLFALGNPEQIYKLHEVLAESPKKIKSKKKNNN